MESCSENTTSNNTTCSATTVFTKAEVIARCSAFSLISVLIVTGNLLTIGLFAIYKKIRKNFFFLVINMACADLMLGAVSLPIYIFKAIIPVLRTTSKNSPLATFHSIFSVVCLQASITFATLISCERLYATHRPLRLRTLSGKAYVIVIILAWTVVLLSSALLCVLRVFVSKVAYFSFWVPYTFILTFIICACTFGIWKTFQLHRRMSSIRRNRALQSRRLTKTLMFISLLALLSWIPIIIMNTLEAINVAANKNLYHLAVLLNVSNCCVNPVVYVLRIPEFRKALSFLWCGRKSEIRKMNANGGRSNLGFVLTPATQLKSITTDLEVLDTKL